MTGSSGGSVREMTSTPVAVVGTLNMDTVVTVAVRPGVGETVLGTSVRERCGGKGANQAIAAAAGASGVALIGTVGDDDAGAAMLANARAAGVDVTHVGVKGDTSGRAFIEVDTSGDNRIVVVPGANSLLSPDAVRSALGALDPRVVLTQLECPPAVTESVATWCTDRCTRFILNPSPVAPLPERILTAADPLVVNEHEARAYADSDTDLAEALLRRTTSAVITLGARGCIVATPGRRSAIAVTPAAEGVETTGAGDHFAGILAARIASGADLHDAAAQAADSATAYIANRHRLAD
ncbi:MAG: ribokinase [Gordonia sp.]|nr:ribokinase [Gordonia sp. (in: high G+C Gram-positive bacteria)]